MCACVCVCVRACMRVCVRVSERERGGGERERSTDQNLRRGRRAEAESSRGPSAYQPNALPLGQTGTQAVPNNNTLRLLHQTSCRWSSSSSDVAIRPEAIWDEEPWTATSTFTQFLSFFKRCFKSTETILRTVRDYLSPGRPPRLSHSS